MSRPRSLYPWYRQRWVDDLALALYAATLGAICAAVVVADHLVLHILQ